MYLCNSLENIKNIIFTAVEGKMKLKRNKIILLDLEKFRKMDDQRFPISVSSQDS